MCIHSGSHGLFLKDLCSLRGRLSYACCSFGSFQFFEKQASLHCLGGNVSWWKQSDNQNQQLMRSGLLYIWPFSFGWLLTYIIPIWHLFSWWLIIWFCRWHLTVAIPSSILRCVHGTPRKESKWHIELEGEKWSLNIMNNNNFDFARGFLSFFSLMCSYSYEEALTCFSTCLPLWVAGSCESRKHTFEVSLSFAHNPWVLSSLLVDASVKSALHTAPAGHPCGDQAGIDCLPQRSRPNWGNKAGNVFQISLHN